MTWGAAEFVAAEEMGRYRGFWWAPDGRSLLATRVDNSPVATWWTSDPSARRSRPSPTGYPVAGSADALVSLWHLGTGPDGAPGAEVLWDTARYPYLVAVHWSRWGPPLLLVEQRDHTACAVLSVDLAGGTTTALVEGDRRRLGGPDTGAYRPGWRTAGWSGRSPTLARWRLSVGDELVTPPGLQVREVTSAGRSVVFSASGADEPEVVEAWRWTGGAPHGLVRLATSSGDGSAAGYPSRPGVVGALGDGPVAVVSERGMGWHGARHAVCVDGSEPRWLGTRAQDPVVEPVVRFLKVGERRLSVGVVLPTGHVGGKLPVVMAPYGGPGHQMVMAARSAWLEAQWLADQGFAVVVADGRGTPGRGPAFEREVYRDLADPVLEDQVEALRRRSAEVPELDLGGWASRGGRSAGYLAALAVLARPGRLPRCCRRRSRHGLAAVRHLLHRAVPRPPGGRARGLRALVAAAPRPALSRPLLLVHGLADDNVYAVHTLRLSAALLSSRPAPFGRASARGHSRGSP